MAKISIRKSVWVDGEGYVDHYFDTIIDDEDFDRVNNSGYCWRIGAFGYVVSSTEYLSETIQPRRNISLHQMLMPALPSFHVHHKNGDKRDNRKRNLVILTASEHMSCHHKARWDKVREEKAKTEA